MVMDANGHSHKASGRPDGGQFERKAGQGTDDDLDFEASERPASPTTFAGLVESGVRDFHGADLRGHDLRGLNLDGVDLTGADLDGANLSGASLKGARLDGARLTNIRAFSIDLTGTSMRGADLSHTTFRDWGERGVSLVDADLTGATLDRFSLLKYDLGQVDVSGIRMKDTKGVEVEFNPLTMASGDFSGAHWTFGRVYVNSHRNGDCVMTGATFHGMTGFNLKGDFHGVDLRGSFISSNTGDFSGACLRGADLVNAYWKGDIVSFRDADLRGCTGFGRHYSKSLDLRGAKLEGVQSIGLKDRTGIRTDRDPEGREPFDPAAYGMTDR